MLSGFGCGVNYVGIEDFDAEVYDSFDGEVEDVYYDIEADLPDVEEESYWDAYDVETIDADDGFVEAPPAPTADYFMDLPCAFPASIGYESSEDSFSLTCGGDPNILYKAPNLSGVGSGDWAIVGNSDGYPSHHIKLSDGYYLVNHSAPHGFTIINEITGAASQSVDLEGMSLVDEEGWPLEFTPNNPSGAVFLGASLCIATSNMDHVDMDPALSTYHPGTVICFPYNYDGTVEDNAGVAYYTSGKNSTGVALVDSDHFAVLSSNSYAPLSGEQAALDIFEWPGMSKTTIYLGEVTAQISPVLNLTSGGMILLSLQQPEATLLGIDIEVGDMPFYLELPEVENFITSIENYNSIAVVSDFGIFGEGGQILFANMDPYGWSDTLATSLSGAPGPSIIIGNTLYQTVSEDAGSMWSVNLASME